MKIKILLLAIIVAAGTSCSNSYKTTQTPDDVYFSPVRALEEEKRSESNTFNSAENREIRMSRYDSRWRNFNDDYNFRYDPYRYGYSYGYYYNPFYHPCPVFISGYYPINPKNSTPRMTNLGSYYYNNMQVVNPKTGTTQMVRSTRTYNNSNRSSLIRRAITPTNDRSSGDNDTRSYSPSSGSSQSSGGRSSSGGAVSRPGRL